MSGIAQVTAKDKPSAANFYDLSLEERSRMTVEAIRSGSTVKFRWENLGSENTADWKARSSKALMLLENVHSVVDLGCGSMALESLLPPNVTYIPVDVVRRDWRTLVVDLNKKIFPNAPADALLGLGILEYIHDLDWLLSTISTRYGTAVLTYNPLSKLLNIEQRISHAWVNHFSVTQLEEKFRAAGLLIEKRIQIDDIQIAWKLRGSHQVNL